jgi:molecular chaperone DnaK
MVREAEEHAAEDKQRRETAETRNTAEQLAYSTDKLIKDNEDKLPEDVKTDVQADVDALKSALAGDDDDAVKAAFDTLSESQQKLGQAIYSQEQAAPSSDANPDEQPTAAQDDEDIVDAEVVEDEPEDQPRGKK